MLQVKATGQSGHIMPIWLPLPEVAKMFLKLEKLTLLVLKNESEVERM